MKCFHIGASALLFIFLVSPTHFQLQAAMAAPLEAQAPSQGVFGGQSTLDQKTVEKYVSDSQKVVNGWLALVDQGRYGESWDAGSTTFKMTIPRKEWIQAMNALRKPIGPVKSRKIIDIGTAENPKGLPAGEYMVYFYETEFSGKPKASELLTLVLERDGQWRVLTYQVL